MHCSQPSRNVLLISGVVISHVLVVLSLLSESLGGEESSRPGVLMTYFASESTSSSRPKKFPVMPQKNSLSNSEIESSNQADGAATLKGNEGASYLTGGATRQPIHGPKPHYPLASKKLREQGLVIVRLCVNDQGIVGEAVVSKSSGFLSLDHSALKTLAQWRFTPIAFNSTGLSLQCFQTPVQFTLEG